MGRKGSDCNESSKKKRSGSISFGKNKALSSINVSIFKKSVYKDEAPANIDKDAKFKRAYSLGSAKVSEQKIESVAPNYLDNADAETKKIPIIQQNITSNNNNLNLSKSYKKKKKNKEININVSDKKNDVDQSDLKHIRNVSQPLETYNDSFSKDLPSKIENSDINPKQPAERILSLENVPKAKFSNSKEDEENMNTTIAKEPSIDDYDTGITISDALNRESEESILLPFSSSKENTNDKNQIKEEEEEDEKVNKEIDTKINRFKKYGTIRKAIQRTKSRRDIKEYVFDENVPDSTVVSNELTEQPILTEEQILKQKREEVISKFISEEVLFSDLVNFATEIENRLSSPCNSGIGKLFSSSDRQNLVTGIDELNLFLSENMELFKNDLQNQKEFYISIYFKNLVLMFQSYKTFIIRKLKAKEILLKSKSEKIKAILQTVKLVEQSGTAFRFMDILDLIHQRIEYYIKYAWKILNLTHKDHPELEILRSALHNLIMFQDVILLIKKDKKILPVRHYSCSASVVELYPDNKRKNRLLVIFSDLLVIADESLKDEKLSLRSFFPIKKIRILEDVEENVVISGQDKLTAYRANIANSRDILFELENGPGKKKNMKIVKLYTSINHDESMLALLSPCYPLKMIVQNKTTISLLFDSKAERDKLKYIINSRSNYQYFDIPIVNNTEVQILLDDLTKFFFDYESTQKINTLGEPFYLESFFYSINDENSPQKDSLAYNGLFNMKILIDFDESVTNTEFSYSFSLDHYCQIFEKFKSRNYKTPEIVNEFHNLLLEDSTALIININKIKGKMDSQKFIISFIQQNLLNKKFDSLCFDIQNLGKFIIYMEFREDFNEQNFKPLFIDKFNHFTPSVQKIIENENTLVPLIMKCCISRMKEYGLDEVGIYRVSGAASKVRLLKEKFEKDMIIGNKEMEDFDVNVCASFLKYFLRELPERLVTYDVSQKLLKWYKTDKSYEELIQILNYLPPANKTAFLFLIDHLCEVENLSNINKMTFSNISTVICPNIFSSSESNIDVPQNVQDDAFIGYISLFVDLLATYKAGNPCK